MHMEPISPYPIVLNPSEANWSTHSLQFLNCFYQTCRACFIWLEGHVQIMLFPTQITIRHTVFQILESNLQSCVSHRPVFRITIIKWRSQPLHPGQYDTKGSSQCEFSLP